MANTKKTVEAPAEVKEAAEVKTEAAAETAKKPAAKKPGRKPAAAAKTEKTAAKKPGRKPAAAKAEKEPAKAEKKTAKKPAAKPGRKPAAAKAEPAAEAAPAKRGRKKGVSYEDIVKAAEKKFLAADVTKIKYPIAANIELFGSVTGDFYVYINADTKEIIVAPYKYDDRDVGFRADAEELMAVLKGKKNIYDALANGLIKVDGITKKAVLLINAAF